MSDIRGGESENRLVSISNEIVNSRYKLSMPTQKFLLKLISDLTYEEKQGGKFLKPIKYNLVELKDFLMSTGLSNNVKTKQRLKDFIDELSTNKIELSKYNEFDQETYTAYSWWSVLSFDENSNIFEFQFNDKISPLLLNLKSYFKSNLKEYLSIKSKQAIDLYILLRADEFKRPKLKYSLDQLKKHLKTINQKSYDDWDFFKRNVLNKSIIQLNKETNYFFSFDIERVGRKVGFVMFTMIEKKDTKKLSELVTEKFKKLLKEQKLLGTFMEKRLERILYKYDPIKDKLTLDIAKTLINPKKIQEFDSWLGKIGFAEKITSKIFRKSTVLTYVGK